MMMSAIKKLSAVDEVFKSLHDQIVSGTLKEGDKLPPQNILAEQFSVSRHTLREAVNKLITMGFLTVKPGVGSVVSRNSPAGYISSLSDHLLMNSNTVADFLEARLFVERATVRLAVIRSTPTDLNMLSQLIAQQEKTLIKKQITTFSKLDAAFHLGLARMSRNEVLSKIHMTLWDLLNKFIYEVSLLPQSAEKAVSFHSLIYQAIKDKDIETADRRMVDHLFDVLQSIEVNTKTDLSASAAVFFPNNLPASYTEAKKNKKLVTAS